MTENDLEAEPSFLVDYHELFVLGIAKKLATIEKDYKTAAELESQYVELNHRAVTNLRKGNQKKVRIVRRWG
jgi:predicted nucleic acid-binding protein